MNGWVLTIVLILLYAIQHMIISRFALRGLRYTRHFAQKTAYEGDRTELVEILRNDRPLYLPWVRSESRISPYLRFGRQENLQVSGERYHKSVFFLRPYQQLTRRHKVTLLHRGVYDAGNVALTAGDLVGTNTKSVQLYTPARIEVYPRLLGEDEIPLPVSRMQGEIITRRRLLQDPFLMNGIRPYQMGDNRRDIHWAATARMNSLQVKTHDYTADTRLLCVLNCQMSETQWADLMDYEQDLIEYAISLAATVCLWGLHQGMAAGFAANMPLEENGDCALLLPALHASREEELLSAFAHIRVSRARNFLSYLEDLSFLEDTDILLLTAYTTPDMEDRIQRLRDRGNTVTVHLLERRKAA